MQFLKTALATALAVVSFGASANIVGAGLDVAEDATELVFFAYSPSAEASYVLDLGVTIADFKANGGAAAGWNFSRAMTSAFTGSVLNGATDLQWAVGAFDTFTASTPFQSGDLQFLSTIQAGSAFTNEMPGLTGFSLNVAQSGWQTWLGTVNLSFGDHQSVANGSSLNVKADGPAYVLDSFAIGTNFANQWTYSQFNAVGTASMFIYATACDLPDGSCLFDGSLTALASTYGNAAGNGMFNFDGTTVTYALAPVPEPSTYALLALGLLAIGARANARRRG